MASTHGSQEKSYFRTHASDFRLFGSLGENALRPPQRAALASIAEHVYSRPSESGIVVMPTGSGKSAVIVGAPFMVGAHRVLVLTPSRLVRQQITEGFKDLADLRRFGVLDNQIPRPAVKEVSKRPTAADWKALRASDVIVSSPSAISPELADVAPMPADFFDLILVDEAHHSAARTWRAVLSLSPNANLILFTATPFRRDKAEVEGRLIFYYPLGRARADGVFGKLKFSPVTPTQGQSTDEAIAIAATHQLLADRKARLAHCLMVRTDAVNRIAPLIAIYKRQGLQLAGVDGSMSLRAVRKIIQRMRDEELDGVVCVNVMGEGFDFPQLKVAALHTPHKSLAATLQFVGRFARTTGKHVGGATFFAVPDESLRIEAARMFRSDANWEQLIPELLERRVAGEVAKRQTLSGYAASVPRDDEPSISLSSICPRYSASVWRSAQGVALAGFSLDEKARRQVARFDSPDRNTMVVVYRSYTPVRWLQGVSIRNVTLELLIAHYHPLSRLLYVASTEDSESFALQAAMGVAKGPPVPLAPDELCRVLRDIENPEFLQIGMRSRATFAREASYMQLMGANAALGLDPSDAARYGRGHFFTRGVEDNADDPMTIGVSSKGKIWSAQQDTVDAFVVWCNGLSKKIRQSGPVRTGTVVDLLPMGTAMKRLPPGIFAGRWPFHVYRHTPRVTADGSDVSHLLADAIISVDPSSPDAKAVSLSVSIPEGQSRFSFEPFSSTTLIYRRTSGAELLVETGKDPTPLEAYLSLHPLEFFASDSSLVVGLCVEPPAEKLEAFDKAKLISFDWNAESVEIEHEKPVTVPRGGGVSIFTWLEKHLSAKQPEVLFCDDGALEMADFVSIETSSDGAAVVSFYHCKASSAASPGARLLDVYEVASQAVRTFSLLYSRASLFEKFAHRAKSKPFLCGDFATMERLIGPGRNAAAVYADVVVVQPGISKAKVTERILQIFAAVSHHLSSGGTSRGLKVWCSK